MVFSSLETSAHPGTEWVSLGPTLCHEPPDLRCSWLGQRWLCPLRLERKEQLNLSLHPSNSPFLSHVLVPSASVILTPLPPLSTPDKAWYSLAPVTHMRTHTHTHTFTHRRTQTHTQATPLYMSTNTHTLTIFWLDSFFSPAPDAQLLKFTYKKSGVPEISDAAKGLKKWCALNHTGTQISPQIWITES